MSLSSALYILGVSINKQQTAVSQDFFSSPSALTSLMVYLTPQFLTLHVACSEAHLFYYVSISFLPSALRCAPIHHFCSQLIDNPPLTVQLNTHTHTLFVSYYFFHSCLLSQIVWTSCRWLWNHLPPHLNWIAMFSRLLSQGFTLLTPLSIPSAFSPLWRQPVCFCSILFSIHRLCIVPRWALLYYLSLSLLYCRLCLISPLHWTLHEWTNIKETANFDHALSPSYLQLSPTLFKI